MYYKLSREQIKKIAVEYGTKKGAVELGKELGVPSAKVSEIVHLLRRRGVNIPFLTTKPQYDIVVRELKEEHPELFEENGQSKKIIKK